MCVILFFFPVELHLLPLHLSSIRKLLSRTVCLVSPFYIELRMRSFYIVRAKIAVLCAGRLRPVKTLLFLPCQELGHPWLSSHRVASHPPITNLHSSKWHWEISLQEQSAQGNSFQTWGQKFVLLVGSEPGGERKLIPVLPVNYAKKTWSGHQLLHDSVLLLQGCKWMASIWGCKVTRERRTDWQNRAPEGNCKGQGFKLWNTDSIWAIAKKNLSWFGGFLE